MKQLAKNITSLIVQVTPLIVFISLLFFVYGSIIEYDVVISQINNLVNGLTGDIETIATDDEKNKLRNFFANMKSPDMTSNDNNIEQSNKTIKDKAIKLISTFVLICLLVSISLTLYYKFDLKYIFLNSFVGLLVVASIEIIFLTFFAKSYQSLDPNYVKSRIINILQNYANS